MQDKSPHRTPHNNIDGFISSRPRRTVGFGNPQPIQQKRTPVQVVPPRRQVAATHHAPHPETPLTVHDTDIKGLYSTLPVKPVKSKFGFGRKKKNTSTTGSTGRSWKRITKRASLVVICLFVLSGGWLGWKVYSNSAKVFGNKNPLHVLSAFKTVKLKGEDLGRVNILLAGDSSDAQGHGGAELTDSIMVVSVDTKNHAASMISIPRDTWVTIPGHGHAKINEAYYDGQNDNFSENGYAAGGMGLLEKVISENYGITANYYSLVNYTAFKQLVDDVGGIDVTIQSPDARGLYDPSFRPGEGGPLKLANGVDHLTGQIALNLARARGDPFNGVRGAYGFPNSDFDRTQHQRQMLLALKDKASSVGVLSNPLKVGKLMDAVGSNVKTDFQLDELVSLYSMMKKINSTDIKSISLNDADGSNLLANYTSPAGQSALIPAAGLDDFSNIRAFLAKAINNDPLVKEAANVIVLNGAGITGLAKQQQTALEAKGYTVSAIADAPKTLAATTIIDNSMGKKPATKKALTTLFGNKYSTDATITQAHPGVDFIIILGQNQASTSNTTSSNSNI